MSVVASWSEALADSALSPVPVLQRAEGRAVLSFKLRGRTSVLDQLYQSGVLRLRLPRLERGQPPEAVLLNTAGGLTGGDRLKVEVRWGAGTKGALSGQAAERVYRSLGGVARVDNSLLVEAGASAEWLPQETILFDNAGLERDLQVRLEGDARFLGVESLVFGRAAMGERVQRGRLRDAWRVWRDGRLVFADAIELRDRLDLALSRAAAARGLTAVALLLLAAPDAEAALPALRARLDGAVGLAAASAWNGLLLARFAAPDGATLRADLLPALAVLRAGQPPPRVWRC